MTAGSRVDLAAGWTLWRWMEVRAAGFPAADVLRLADADVATAADVVAAAEHEAAAVRATAIDELWRLYRERGPLARAAKKAAEQLQRGKLATDPEVVAAVSALRSLQPLDQALAERRAELDAAYARALARTADVLRDISADARFREALLWQNRSALRAADWLLAHPDAANNRVRQNQQLLASYLQRYCVKNDTIGFFGPIAWGQVVASNEVSIAPGTNLLREREVFFEHWAVDVVAKTIAAWPEARPHIAPRLMPTVAVHGATLQYGFDRTKQLAPAIARVLAACDGETPAIDIARAVTSDPSLDVSDPQDVYDLLDDLVERKLVVWTLEPNALVRPDRVLRAMLERIEDASVRTRALAILDTLEAGRAEVAAAAGDVERLDRALSQLDTLFSEQTSHAATRRAGEMYAGRTIVYEECVRDFSLTIGAPIVKQLAPVFSLVAESARWFTYEIARRYRAEFVQRYRTLAATTAGPVRYVALLGAIEDLLPEAHAPGPLAAAIATELEGHWASILNLDMSQSRVNLSAASLADPVKRAFAAPGAGWPGARHVAPDVMIAARSIDDLAAGNATLVLGEVHIVNTQMARLLVLHGPGGADRTLVDEYDRDHAGPRVLSGEPLHRVTRADSITWSERDLDLEVGTTKSWRPRPNVMRVADLVVEDAGDTLRVVHSPSGRTFDIIQMLEAYMAVMGNNHFKPAPRGDHVPRVTIDGVVLSREQWRFSRDDLQAFSADERGPAQFARARAWARQHGLPRWVFVKIPEETKPVFVDFASPTYVDMFSKLARQGSSIVISEMLPTVDDTWLVDGAHKTYTAELRFIAVDPLPWAAPA